MRKPQVNGVEQKVNNLREDANVILNDAIEQEMWNIIRNHPSIGVILKCMGEVTIYTREHGSICRDEWPVFMQAMSRLEELDIEYFSVTGNPLKLERLPNGGISAKRDW